MLILRAVMKSGVVVDQEQEGIYEDDNFKNAALRKFILMLMDNEGSLDGDFIERVEWLAY